MFPLGAFGTPYFHDAQMQGPTLTDSIFNTLPLFNMTLSADTGRPFTTQETASLNQAIRTEVLRLYTNELSQRKNQLFFRVGEHQRCNSFNEPGIFIQEICYPHSLACLELPSGPVLTSIGLNQWFSRLSSKVSKRRKVVSERNLFELCRILRRR